MKKIMFSTDYVINAAFDTYYEMWTRGRFLMRIISGFFRRYNTKAFAFMFLILAVVFLAGTAGGSFFAVKTGEYGLSEFADNINYSALHSLDNPRLTLARSFISIAVLILIIWISGFFPKPFCVTVLSVAVCYKGFVTGYTAAMLIRGFVLRGIALAVVSILPQYLILLPLVYFLGAAAFSYERNSAAAGEYIKLISIAMVMAFLAAMSDAVIAGRLINIVFKI